MHKQELGIFIGLNRINNWLNKDLDKIYLSFGLTRPQFAVLEALYHKGDLTIGCVQELVLSSSGTIPVVVKNLVKAEFIEKIQDQLDKRKFVLKLLPKGRDLMDKVFPKVEERITQLIGIWDDDEQAQILKLFLKAKGEMKNGKKDIR